MSAALRLKFDSLEVFREEFEKNISMGGTFVPTDSSLEFREAVTIEIDLAFRGTKVELEAEVVTVIPAEMGGTSGVAVQFTDSPRELRARLGPFIGLNPADEKRAAPRRVARVEARLTVDGASIGTRTRNLSQTGALISFEGAPVPVGEAVTVVLQHPKLDEQFEVPGRVVRHLEADGVVTALAVEFEPKRSERRRMSEFIDDIQASEHAQRLRGVSGAIDELGMMNLVQVFGSCSPSGTLVLTRGNEEGRLAFEGGNLLEVSLGGASGIKALTRLLAWRDGSFEFQAAVVTDAASSEPTSLEASLLEAARQMDELEKLDLRGINPKARYRPTRLLDAERSFLSKTEDSLLELASAGMPLRNILDVIPEPDLEIYHALVSLLDRRLLEPSA